MTITGQLHLDISRTTKLMENVAIAIPCYNSGNTISQTLESLLQTRHLKGSTFILLDGGSTDLSLKIFNWFEKKYDHSFKFETRIFPDMHPAERINSIMQERKYEFLFICHSDDIYNTPNMYKQLQILESSETWASAAQCEYFLDPIDGVILDRPLYAGEYKSHPQATNKIYCEMALWWTISWNTILLKPTKIVDANILLEPAKFKFCNDYKFNWELAKLNKISNVSFSTVATRHRSKGDGPTNIDAVNREAAEIKNLIQEEIGLTQFLGRHLRNVMNSLNYTYGSWKIEKKLYPNSHYQELSKKMIKFSLEHENLSHFKELGMALIRVLNDS